MSKGTIPVLIIIYYALANLNCNQMGSDIGDYSPDFTLDELSGKQYKLSNYYGKETLLYFWADCCTVDTTLFSFTQKIYDKLHQNNIELLTINIGNSNELRSRISNKKISFPILLDENLTIAKMYKVRILPTLVVISKKGKITRILKGWENKEYLNKIYYN